ncbi:hypothetical protein KKH39_04190 [Patescibacteria group bacterium]|nr:hypothetical protein [Patescibacteria group bacterium]
MKFFVVIPEEDGVMGSYYFDEPSYKKVLKKTYQRVLSNYKSHLTDYIPARDRILESSKILSQGVGKVSDKELFVLFKNYISSVYDFFDYILIPFALIEYAEPELIRLFPEDFEKIINSDKPTQYQLMEKMLLEEGPQMALEKYGWLKSYYIGEGIYTIEELEKMSKELDRDKVEKIFAQFSRHKKEFDNFISKLDDEEIKAKCILFHEYIFLRNDRVDSWKHSLFIISRFFEYLKDKFENISLKAVANLSYEEIEDILTKAKLPEAIDLAKREKNFLYYYDGSLNIVTDKVQIEKIKQIVKKQINYIDQLQGISATRGVVKGKVKIVNSYKEISKIEKGDILVAQMTDPRYTPAMRLAAAIVTDEGGMLSHAAITSRELKVPCVVGTNYATKVLKDGDMVEVDANNGIIKKL